MEPIIYYLPKPEKIFELKDNDFYFDDQPGPKLIKYGFNKTIEKLNFLDLTSDPHYRVGLNFDFERTDNESISKKSQKIFGTKIDENFGIFWEILNLFGMINQDQNIFTNIPETIEKIISSHQKISGSKNKIGIKSKDGTSSKNKYNLIIQKYSDVDLDENAIVQLLLNNLPDLISKQTIGSSMILQIFSCQTKIMVQIIYYLSSFYEETYLMKPLTSSNLSDEKYLILLGLRQDTKIKFAKNSPNTYLISINIDQIDPKFEMLIQCMNSVILPQKFIYYYNIKNYLDSKIYEGAAYQEMIANQNDNTIKWLEIFSNVTQMETILDIALKKTADICHNNLV